MMKTQLIVRFVVAVIGRTDCCYVMVVIRGKLNNSEANFTIFRCNA